MSGVNLIMNSYNYIKEILNDCPDFGLDMRNIKFKKLTSGKTNQSFFIEDDLKKYVLRLNSKKSHNYNIGPSERIKNT